MDQEEEKSEVNLNNCLRFQYFKKAMFKGTKRFEILGTIVFASNKMELLQSQAPVDLELSGSSASWDF